MTRRIHYVISSTLSDLFEYLSYYMQFLTFLAFLDLMKEQFEHRQSQNEDVDSSPSDDPHSLSSSPNAPKFHSVPQKELVSIFDMTNCVSVPKILTYMCEYLLTRGCNVVNLFTRNVDEEQFVTVFN